MCPGEALISPYINLPVAHSTDSAPCLFWYPWRTYFRCAMPKCAQAGRPGTSFPFLAFHKYQSYRTK